MGLNSVIVRKTVAGYLVLGGILCYILVLSKLGFYGFLETLWPALFITFWYLFTIISGISYLKHPNSKLNKSLLEISLAIQAIQFFILGVNYQNYFGPFLGIGISFNSSFNFFFEYHLLAFRNFNGYDGNDSSLQVSINLIPVVILVLISYLEKKEKRQEIEETTLSVDAN